MAQILHETIMRVSADKLFKALTEQDGLRAWLTPEAIVEPPPGTQVILPFDNGQRALTMEVVELIPERKVKWLMREGFGDWEQENDVLTWQLAPMERGTLIHFTHDGWTTTDGAFASVSFKWAWFMVNLKLYVETGKRNVLA